MHKPVLLKEVIEYLEPKPGENFIDCNYGNGGHSKEILKHILPKGKILGIDADPQVTGGNNIKLIHNNFVNLKSIYEHSFFYPIDGILFDLGYSSDQLESSGRGFSFQKDEELDMRYDPDNQRLTAAEVLNKYGRHKLAYIFKEYGEVGDKLAKSIAHQIIIKRGSQRFERTGDFVVLLGRRKGRLHPATKFFQALRIEVNNELDNLNKALPQALEILKPQGRLAVISFHSLEDRIVKNYFRNWAKEGQTELLTKKPIVAGEQELKNNPRARSAKLRVCVKNLSKTEKKLSKSKKIIGAFQAKHIVF